MDSEKCDFFKTMMQENLSHARHVENERMSLAMGMTVLVSGSWAISGDAIADGMAGGACEKWEQIFSALVVCIIVLIVLFFAISLNGRWNKVFSNHWNSAKKCYTLLDNRAGEDALYPFWESAGKTERKFVWLYCVLIGSMCLLICVLICYLRGIDLHGILVG